MPIIQGNAKNANNVPKNPKAVDYAKSAEADAGSKADVHAPSAALCTYALPPGTSKII